MPDKTVIDLANQVKSYALGIKDQQVLGAWNLLKNDGLATSTTEGATFTKNADLSVTINRETATTNASYYNVTSGTNGEVTETRESGTYYISGVPSGSTGLTLQYYDVTASQSWNDSGSGAEITVVKGHTIKVSMRIAPNQTLSNVTVKPMISTQPNQPYVPYAMTNKELTAKVQQKIIAEAAANQTWAAQLTSLWSTFSALSYADRTRCNLYTLVNGNLYDKYALANTGYGTFEMVTITGDGVSMNTNSVIMQLGLYYIQKIKTANSEVSILNLSSNTNNLALALVME